MKKLSVCGICLAIFTTLLSGCSHETGNQLKKRENYLAGAHGKSWRITKIVAGNQDFTPYISKNDRDNITTFYSDRIYQMDEGVMKAHANSPQITNAGTWKFSADYKRLTIENNNDIQNWDVLELTEKELKISCLDGGFSNEVTYCLR
jgi:hypothetical protein